MDGVGLVVGIFTMKKKPVQLWNTTSFSYECLCVSVYVCPCVCVFKNTKYVLLL